MILIAKIKPEFAACASITLLSVQRKSFEHAYLGHAINPDTGIIANNKTLRKVCRVDNYYKATVLLQLPVPLTSPMFVHIAQKRKTLIGCVVLLAATDFPMIGTAAQKLPLFTPSNCILTTSYQHQTVAMILPMSRIFTSIHQWNKRLGIPTYSLNNAKLDAVDLTIFKSGVGKLLYLTKLS